MKLILENKAQFEGKSFGAPTSIAGEVVFTTGMVGYPEAFSDPSYRGQIVVCTYPLIGNYGVPDLKSLESSRMQIAGLVVSEYSETHSSHTAKQSLAAWLKASHVPALTGVDTRAITKLLRERGVMLGQLIHSGKQGAFTDPNENNLVAEVSPKRVTRYGNGKKRIVLVDCGAKENIARALQHPDVTVLRVPWNYDFTQEKYDGLVLSNGPGDPTACTETINHIRAAFRTRKPILGICLGTQLLALAAGAKTYKLKYGHRSQNQPASDVLAAHPRTYITSQNHGYAVDERTLPKEWRAWFLNANDGSVEGIAHRTKPWRAVQFHPEATPGPTDTEWIFADFLKDVGVHTRS